MYNAFEPRTSEREVFATKVRIEGTGAADPTELLGAGVAITRLAAVGKYQVAWASNPGTFAGVKGFSFQATTPSDLRGYTVVFGDYAASGGTYTLPFWVYDSTFTLDDLEAGWKLAFDVDFKRTRS